jgi:predicted RNA-binding protein YlxR (DUF448 family)
MKKANLRSDIVSGERFPRNELIRLVADGKKLSLDPTGTHLGRGVYVRKNVTSFLAAKKTKAFARAFRREVKEEEIDELIASLQKLIA